MAKYNTSVNNFLRNSPVTSVSGNYSALQTDEVIEFSSTASSYTLTLPAPSITGVTANKGKTYVIKDSSGGAATNNITIAPASGTIDGSASLSIGIAYGFVQVYCDGTAWFTQSTATAIGSSTTLALVSLVKFGNPFNIPVTTFQQNFAADPSIVVFNSTSTINLSSLTTLASQNVSVGTNQITVNSSGMYQVDGITNWFPAAGSVWFSQIVKNSSSVLGSAYANSNASEPTMIMSFIVSLNAGDTIDLRVAQNNTGGGQFVGVELNVKQIPTAVGTLTTVQPPTRTYLGSSFSSSTQSSWLDIGLSTVVPAGTYTLKFNLTGTGVNNGAGTLDILARLVNVTAGNTYVSNSQRNCFSIGYGNGFSAQGSGTVYFDLLVSNGSATTYKVQAIKVTSGGGPNTGQSFTIGLESFIEYEALAAVVASSTQFTWQQVSTTSQALDNGNGYYCTNAGLTTLTLPASPTPGTEIKIQGTATNVGFWRIAQNAGQKIYFGNQATTTGVGGSITSTNARDSISLLCTSVTEFEVTSAVGNLTVV